jgi:hypothetical protein
VLHAHSEHVHAQCTARTLTRLKLPAQREFCTATRYHSDAAAAAHVERSHMCARGHAIIHTCAHVGVAARTAPQAVQTEVRGDARVAADEHCLCVVAHDTTQLPSTL